MLNGFTAFERVTQKNWVIKGRFHSTTNEEVSRVLWPCETANSHVKLWISCSLLLPIPRVRVLYWIQIIYQCSIFPSSKMCVSVSVLQEERKILIVQFLWILGMNPSWFDLQNYHNWQNFKIKSNIKLKKKKKLAVISGKTLILWNHHLFWCYCEMTPGHTLLTIFYGGCLKWHSNRNPHDAVIVKPWFFLIGKGI